MKKKHFPILVAILMLFTMIPLVSMDVHAENTFNISMEIYLYDKTLGSWVDARDYGAVSSYTINEEPTVNIDVPYGETVKILVAPQTGYMVSTIRVNDNYTYSSMPEGYVGGPDRISGQYVLTFTPQSGSDYYVSVSMQEAVRVTYDKNGGTVNDTWWADSFLMSKGSTISSIGPEIEQIIPPAGKELDYVEVITADGNRKVMAENLGRTAHTYNTDVTFKCYWKTSGKSEPVLVTPSSVESVTIKKKPKILKPAASKNKITVKWKHFKYTSKAMKPLWKKIKKVQIQCATDKAFKNTVKTFFVKKKKTKAYINGLKKNTVYYVRIRYFDGKNYSKWSGPKRIKTLKK